MEDHITVRIKEEDTKKLERIICEINQEGNIDEIKVYQTSAIVLLRKINSKEKASSSPSFYVPSTIKRLYSQEKAKFLVHSSEYTINNQIDGGKDINIVCSYQGKELYAYYLIPKNRRSNTGTVALFCMEYLVNVLIKFINPQEPYFTFAISKKFSEFDHESKIIIRDVVFQRGEKINYENTCPVKYLSALRAGLNKACDNKIEFRYGKFNR